MGVRALWQCDRDGKMFTSKKEADLYDKMLELAELVSDVIGSNVEGLNEGQLENIGRLVAENKEQFTNAFKGKLDDLECLTQKNEEAEIKEDKVTPIAKAS
ncbi:YebG family protein [Catenovulum sp. SM1970]|uniref:YebG family protein n=1 Tax=Marinifaba aquimaris TaxID=2741323 RepID=UPI0015717399|nr:YebG family protein [Marinifaba aquimaris]NTS78341.1 YebG family protein [Marinifaba aquimaris]